MQISNCEGQFFHSGYLSHKHLSSHPHVYRHIWQPPGPQYAIRMHVCQGLINERGWRYDLVRVLQFAVHATIYDRLRGNSPCRAIARCSLWVQICMWIIPMLNFIITS